MNDPITRLTAGIAEDEACALSTSPGPWHPNAEHDEVLAVDDITVCDGFALSGNQLRATVEYIVRHDPARSFLEVNAFRNILDEHRRTPSGHCDTCHDSDFAGGLNCVPWPCPTIRFLASIYPEAQQ
jgi:hypothetical protein